MLMPDKRYSGVILPGSALIESGKGTIGFQIQLSCEDGDTSFVVWLTRKNRDRAIATFTELGIPEAKLTSDAYIEHELGPALTGQVVAFGTREDSYKGKVRTVVAWVGKGSDTAGNRSLSARAAGFFATQPAAEANGKAAGELEDDDIPF